MESTGSSAAGESVAQQVQQASQQYILCRRNMSKQSEQLKALNTQLQEISDEIEFQADQPDGGKSVGKVELTIAEVAGKSPAEGTVIHVALDSEDADTSTEHVKSVAWDAAEQLPKTFVFDSVPSTDASVSITVFMAGEEGSKSLREIELPISSLIESETLDVWYNVQDESNTTTEVTTVVEEEDVPDNTTTESKTVTETVEKTEDGETKIITEVVETTVEEGESKEEELVAVKADKEITGSQFHVTATFEVSESEKLRQESARLTKLKAESEASLAKLEQEASELRAQYERLTATQQTASSAPTGTSAPTRSAPSVAKTRSTKLTGRNGPIPGQRSTPAAPPSLYSRVKTASVGFFQTNQQVLTSVAFFVVGTYVFHNHGDNLLA